MDGGIDLPGIVELLESGGVLLAVVLAVVGVLRGWWHTDREFQDERADKLEWKAIALEALALSRSSVGLAETAAADVRQTALGKAADSAARRRAAG